MRSEQMAFRQLLFEAVFDGYKKYGLSEVEILSVLSEVVASRLSSEDLKSEVRAVLSRAETR